MKLMLLVIIFIFFIILQPKKYIETMSNKQKQFKSALEDMKKILDKNNIKFHLHSGTALGAIREQKFIEYDLDIDLGVLDSEVDIKKIPKLVEEKFILGIKFPKNEDKNDVTEYAFHHRKTNVKIDIFLVQEKNNKYYTNSYTGYCDKKPNKTCVYSNSKYKLNNINFLEKLYKVPEIKFLEEQYGKDWRTPKNFGYSEGVLKGYYKNLL